MALTARRSYDLKLQQVPKPKDKRALKSFVEKVKAWLRDIQASTGIDCKFSADFVPTRGLLDQDVAFREESGLLGLTLNPHPHTLSVLNRRVWPESKPRNVLQPGLGLHRKSSGREPLSLKPQYPRNRDAKPTSTHSPQSPVR